MVQIKSIATGLVRSADICLVPGVVSELASFVLNTGGIFPHSAGYTDTKEMRSHSKIVEDIKPLVVLI